MSSLPYLKFYPSDWLSEESLRLVSFAARGLWIDLLCLMAKNERRGYLGVNGGVNPTLAQMAKLVGSTEAEIAPLLDELKQAGTCSVDADGSLFSRRIVRDTELYDQAVTFGSKGGNPKLKKKQKRVNPPVNLNGQPPLAMGSNMGSGMDPITPDVVYGAYPRKVAKKDAIKAIHDSLKEHAPEYLLKKTQAYALAVSRWPAEDQRFIPHPATWFKRGSFDDDPTTWERIPHANNDRSNPDKRPNSRHCAATDSWAENYRQAKAAGTIGGVGAKA